MEILNYKIIKYQSEHEAICIEYPYITWVADTKEDALMGIQESMFREFLEQDKLMKLNWPKSYK